MITGREPGGAPRLKRRRALARNRLVLPLDDAVLEQLANSICKSMGRIREALLEYVTRTLCPAEWQVGPRR